MAANQNVFFSDRNKIFWNLAAVYSALQKPDGAPNVQLLSAVDRAQHSCWHLEGSMGTHRQPDIKCQFVACDDWMWFSLRGDKVTPSDVRGRSKKTVHGSYLTVYDFDGLEQESLNGELQFRRWPSRGLIQAVITELHWAMIGWGCTHQSLRLLHSLLALTQCPPPLLLPSMADRTFAS